MLDYNFILCSEYRFVAVSAPWGIADIGRQGQGHPCQNGKLWMRFTFFDQGHGVWGVKCVKTYFTTCGKFGYRYPGF